MRTITDPAIFRASIKEKLNEIIDDEKYTANLEIGIFKS